VSFSTTKALMPERPCDLSTLANTTMYSEMAPRLQYILLPLMTQVSPSRVAVVASPLVSDPAPDSESPKPVRPPCRTIGSYHRSTCSGVPIAPTTKWPRPWFIDS